MFKEESRRNATYAKAPKATGILIFLLLKIVTVISENDLKFLPIEIEKTVLHAFSLLIG